MKLMVYSRPISIGLWAELWVALADDHRETMESGSVSLLVLLYLMEAFNVFVHTILPHRLSDMEIGGTVLCWFCSFLSDRSYRVVLGVSCSTSWSLVYGVSQRSILFNINMKLLGSLV